MTMNGFDALASSSVPSVMMMMMNAAGVTTTTVGGGGGGISAGRTTTTINNSGTNNNNNNTSGDGGGGGVSWKRSLSELAAATNQPYTDTATVATSSSASVNYRSNIGGGGGGGSGVGLGEGGGIDTVVMRRRTDILQKLVNQQEQNLQRRLDGAVNKKLSDDWTMEREWWRKELIGDRNSVVISNGGGMAAAAAAAASLSYGNGPSSASTNRLLMSNSSGPARAFEGHGGSGGPTGTQPTAIVQQHLDVVQKFILQGEGNDIGSDRTSSHHLLKVVEAFQNLAASTAAADVSNSNSSGYLTAWKILASILPRVQNTKLQQQQTTTTTTTTTIDSRAMSAACGAMFHYCHQYYTLITSKVNEATLAGLDVSTASHYANSMASTVASYTKLVVGSQLSDIWTKLYYCEFFYFSSFFRPQELLSSIFA